MGKTSRTQDTSPSTPLSTARAQFPPALSCLRRKAGARRTCYLWLPGLGVTAAPSAKARTGGQTASAPLITLPSLPVAANQPRSSCPRGHPALGDDAGARRPAARNVASQGSAWASAGTLRPARLGPGPLADVVYRDPGASRGSRFQGRPRRTGDGSQGGTWAASPKPCTHSGGLEHPSRPWALPPPASAGSRSCWVGLAQGRGAEGGRLWGAALWEPLPTLASPLTPESALTLN